MNNKLKNVLVVVAFLIIGGVVGYFIGKSASTNQAASLYQATKSIKNYANKPLCPVTISTAENETTTRWVPCNKSPLEANSSGQNPTVGLAQTINDPTSGPAGLMWKTIDGYCYGYDQNDGGGAVIYYKFPGACPMLQHVTPENAAQILKNPKVFLQVTGKQY